VAAATVSEDLEGIAEAITKDSSFMFVRQAAADAEYIRLAKAVRHHDAGADAACLFRKCFEDLSVHVVDGQPYVVLGHRLVIPAGARSKMLEILHLPHAGISKTQARVCMSMYWPGMNNDIATYIGDCEA